MRTKLVSNAFAEKLVREGRVTNSITSGNGRLRIDNITYTNGVKFIVYFVDDAIYKAEAE